MSKRYCGIRCESLEDILETCKRHRTNNMLSWTDAIDNEDITETDVHYFKMISGMWRDLQEDVEAMLERRHNER